MFESLQNVLKNKDSVVVISASIVVCLIGVFIGNNLHNDDDTDKTDVVSEIIKDEKDDNGKGIDTDNIHLGIDEITEPNSENKMSENNEIIGEDEKYESNGENEMSEHNEENEMSEHNPEKNEILGKDEITENHEMSRIEDTAKGIEHTSLTPDVMNNNDLNQSSNPISNIPPNNGNEHPLLNSPSIASITSPNPTSFTSPNPTSFTSLNPTSFTSPLESITSPNPASITPPLESNIPPLELSAEPSIIADKPVILEEHGGKNRSKKNRKNRKSKKSRKHYK